MNPMPESSSDIDCLRDIVNKIRRVAGRAEFKQLFPEQKLQQDLQLDSLDLAEMTVRIDAKFGVDVFHHGVVITVQDVLTELRGQSQH